MPMDKVGPHSAVMTYTDQTGAFPPNTLFRLKEVKEPGTWEAPGGVYPHCKLLVVTATYLVPMNAESVACTTTAAGLSDGKLCAAPVTLRYGNREAYINGIDKLIAKVCTHHPITRVRDPHVTGG